MATVLIRVVTPFSAGTSRSLATSPSEIALEELNGALRLAPIKRDDGGGILPLFLAEIAHRARELPDDALLYDSAVLSLRVPAFAAYWFTIAIDHLLSCSAFFGDFNVLIAFPIAEYDDDRN